MQSANGEAKFWLDRGGARPDGLGPKELKDATEMRDETKRLGKPFRHLRSPTSLRTVWLLVDERELFLPFTEFPWFREASVAAICKVERPRAEHFHWPALDGELTLESILHPRTR